LTINISSNKKIDIQNNVKIVKSFGKLEFIGDNGDTSVLNFINSESQLYFTENVKEIEFRNLSIIGNLFFENNINVTFNSVLIFGSINSNFDKYNENVSLINVNYQSSTISTDYCINLGGNVYIDNSQFLGSSLCKLRLLYFSGLEKYNLEIKNSYFDGNYQCPCLKVDRGKNVNINSSYFTRGYIGELNNLNGGGAAIKFSRSDTFIQNCTFKDIYSEMRGGVFELENTHSFKADNLEAYNVTSVDVGSMAFIFNDMDNLSTVYFKNIKQIDSGTEHVILNGGVIMALMKYANVDIDTYYAENLISRSKCANAFLLQDDAEINIKNTVINKIRSNCMDSVFINTVNTIKPIIKAKNVTINDAYQAKVGSGILLWLNSNTQVELKDIKVINSGGPSPK